MGGKSSGPGDGGAAYRDQFVSQIINQANKKKGSGGGVNIANLQDYKDMAALYKENERIDPKRWGGYGASDEVNKLVDNVSKVQPKVDLASVDNLNFDSSIEDLAGLKSNTAKSMQSDILEQMKALFENRKQSILDRTLRPGQAATRGQSL